MKGYLKDQQVELEEKVQDFFGGIRWIILVLGWFLKNYSKLSLIFVI